MIRDPEAFLPLPQLPLQILLALAAGGPAHGYAVIKRIEEMMPGAQPSSGSLYLAMVRLKERGLLAEADPPEHEETDARRRYYRLTPLGKEVTEAESRRLAKIVSIAESADLLPRVAE